MQQCGLGIAELQKTRSHDSHSQTYLLLLRRLLLSDTNYVHMVTAAQAAVQQRTQAIADMQRKATPYSKDSKVIVTS